MRAYDKLKNFMKEAAEVPELEPPPEPVTQPSDTESTPERLCFDLNANRTDGERATPKDFIPAGSTVSYHSPLFGDLDAEVLDDRGECLWVWNPIRECESSIPRSWLTGIVETPTGKEREQMANGAADEGNMTEPYGMAPTVIVEPGATSARET